MGNPSESEPEEFGEYLVYERLGVGGMATVHRAKKRGIEGFERVVALKRLLSHLVEDEHFIASFVREARLASLLQHANVVQIYDLGRVSDVYYIAMEYLRGVDLRQILRQSRYATGAPPIPFTVALMNELLDGLDYAHNLADESGVPLNLVHRDVSPSNAIVARDGHLKLIDFGIAKATTPSLRTRSGHVKGKFAYMAPEALGAEDLDRRSDVFSAGIVMWELLTARPLFAGRTDFDTIQRVRKMAVPPPSSINPACPADLDDIVLTALARDKEERWGSAAAMQSAIGIVADRYSVRATNREVAEWIQWAFDQPRLPPGQPRTPPASSPVPVPRRGANHPSNPFAILNAPPSPTMAPLDDGMDEVSIEIVWGKDDEAPSVVIEIVDPGSQRVASWSVDEAQPSAPVNDISAAIPAPKRTVPGAPFGSAPPTPAQVSPTPAQGASAATLVPVAAPPTSPVPAVAQVASADQPTALAIEPPREAVEAYIAAMADAPTGDSPFDPQAALPTKGVKQNAAFVAAPMPPSHVPSASAPRPSQIVREVRHRKGLPAEPPKTESSPEDAASDVEDVFAARITTYAGGGGLRAWHYLLFAIVCICVAAAGFYFARIL